MRNIGFGYTAGGISPMEKAVISVVKSPCVRNCCLDDADICVGCWRSLEEITRWSLIGDEEKLQVLTKVAARKLPQKPALDTEGTSKAAGT